MSASEVHPAYMHRDCNLKDRPCLDQGNRLYGVLELLRIDQRDDRRVNEGQLGVAGLGKGRAGEEERCGSRNQSRELRVEDPGNHRGRVHCRMRCKVVVVVRQGMQVGRKVVAAA